jgi:hypothetical protein
MSRRCFESALSKAIVLGAILIGLPCTAVDPDRHDYPTRNPRPAKADTVWGVDGGLTGLPPEVVTKAILGRREPWIHPLMPESVRRKLDSGLEVAMLRVRDDAQCAGLFHALGGDGIRALQSTMYFVASLSKEASQCRTSAAYTQVGEVPSFLCRRFAYLSDQQAATILIHEALHLVGLTEQPHDPNALPGYAINRVVRRACKLE